MSDLCSKTSLPGARPGPKNGKISTFVACTIWIVAACSSLIASVVSCRSRSDQLPKRGHLSTEQS